MPPLWVACAIAHRGVALQLLHAGAAAAACDGLGTPCLCVAAQRGKAGLPLVEVLLEHSAPADAADGNGNTALLFAAHGGHLPLVRLLLRGGAPVELANKDGLTPLQAALLAVAVAVALTLTLALALALALCLTLTLALTLTLTLTRRRCSKATARSSPPWRSTEQRYIYSTEQRYIYSTEQRSCI